MQGQTLLGDMEDCKIPLYCLLLTGVATPYLHNGISYYDQDGQSLVIKLILIGLYINRKWDYIYLKLIKFKDNSFGGH